ncbi:MAG: M48 family metallopeptidase [Jatrophihabitantaceae bacterium]
MNFFERQHAVRGTSTKLVALFVLAVVAMVAVIDLVVLLLTRSQPGGSVVGWLITATAAMLLIIGGGTLTKTIALRAGGSAVALSVGAVAIDPTTSDPALKRFVNIVEEMSIASGVPMPRLFVLEREPGINAFAAGYTPADAAVTVTGGALHQLTRDELQGVIGHEFSHILNGDMRLNIRLIGLLNGILLIGLIGLRIMVFGGGGRRSNKDNGVSPMLVIAIAMMVLGFVGQFFAGLIKAAVSRQREWLADASSVQFTRQTGGLAGALKKIAGLPTGSELHNKSGATEVSHMLFSEGGRSFSQLYATHPPLLKRIQALDPQFRPEQLVELSKQWQASPPDTASGLTGTAPSVLAAPTVATAAVVATAVGSRVGTMTPDDLANGAELSRQIPPNVRQLAIQASTAVPLMLALMLNSEPDLRARQLALIATRLSDSDSRAAAALSGQLSTLPAQLRLPLVSLAVPLITARPRPSLEALVQVLDELAAIDGQLTLFEYCLTRLVSSYVQDAASPHRRSTPGRTDLGRVSAAAYTLLAAMAAGGNDDPQAAEHAFHAAAAVLAPGATVAYQPQAGRWQVLDAGWPVLDSVDPRQKQTLVQALVVAVRDDGVLTLHEAELLRTACALLHCPLPGFIA